ncbi:aminotransferase class I/II-fold pyridoxal phosphate-dependent enzyme [Paenibacillus sp. LHD-117]|uniref:aminotransferase class I/II-fold pyridoxal phosphate-dependent enzyme n=1 Tax=Paenibacillus sp. LHD-117 TaxID=3071412 RepID=UPI0027DF734D|nr:aminotransferase class I/II-fold pyridoxal phosphate-dependent enzyme [Paenibacillus sp. LHD-117]MDQ6420779.1 aminotransferase class I/II-fold pyridoxal phosphate-dependent enzyme [Paenibacillus sp. LHD-117]
MKQLYAPIYEALMKHAKVNPISFHVPGHQNGKAWEEISLPLHLFDDMKNRFASIMEIDLTELSSTDDLHHPEASINDAQSLAARCFGADETYFLVGGSTSGNLAMLLAVCDPGDIVIVQRNVHKSVINGLRMAGASAVFLSPQVDSRTGLADVPSVIQVKEALERYPDAKAVFLSNPNYYGIGMELTKYVEVVHRYGIPLLVDEAHGAHYGQHPELPRSAMMAGADAAVQSTHKTLPALTMGAMLHVRGDLIDRERLKQALAMVQSSSPSFPLLASLDISRAMIDSLKDLLFQQALEHARSFRMWLKESGLMIGAIEAEKIEIDSWSGVRQSDPLRMVLYDQTGSLSGHQLHKLLEEQGCWAEMSDPVYVVLLIGIGTRHEHIERLKSAIMNVHAERLGMGQDLTTDVRTVHRNPSNGVEDELGEPIVFGGGWFSKQASMRVPLHEAIGYRAAEMVVPYPPGIPLLYQGEKITAGVVARLERLAAAGAKFQGAQDSRMATIAVYNDRS